MKKVSEYIVLTVGAIATILLLAIVAKPAINEIAGLAAAAGTAWNNVQDAGLAGDNVTKGLLGTGLYIYDGTNFDRVRGTGGSINVSSTGTTTPTDAFANPTTANLAFSLIAGWNGTTWDRIFSQGTNADAEATRTLGALETDSHIRGWNGTTFDRIRSGSVGADAVATTTTGNLSAQSYAFEFNGTTFDRIRHSFNQNTAGVTTNAAGTTVTMTTTPMSKFTMTVDRTAGATDAVEIDLECSLNNTAFIQIATITSLAGEPILTSFDGTPCNYMRYNVVTVGAGNTLTISLLGVR